MPSNLTSSPTVELMGTAAARFADQFFSPFIFLLTRVVTISPLFPSTGASNLDFRYQSSSFSFRVPTASLWMEDAPGSTRWTLPSLHQITRYTVMSTLYRS